jgi:hypothetical protein
MRIAYVIAGIVLPGSLAFAGCWIASGTASCCSSWAKLGAGGGDEWPCAQDPVPGTGGPYTITTASPVGAGGSGWDKLSSTPAGTCQMIFRTCGQSPGECIYSSTSTVTCVNTSVAGVVCTVSAP